MLAMLYCMAIMRLVNGVVEKTRKKTEISIAEAADAIGIPLMLIDIHHEGSHRDLPSLRLLRLASVKALDWLKSYYWEPQQKEIVFQRDGTAHIRKEITSKLHELVFCLKAKQRARSSSSLVKEKDEDRFDILQGGDISARDTTPVFCHQHPPRPKERSAKLLRSTRRLFSAIGALQAQSKGSPSGRTQGYLHILQFFNQGSDSKKQITKMMKTLVRLYSSFSSEVVSVLLECMLKASDALDLVENPQNSQVGSSIDNSLNVTDEWKLVITKLSNKEPKLLPTLLKAVLDMIETQKAVEYEIGNQQLISLENKSEDRQVELLSSLFAWLVRILKVLKPSRQKFSSAENEDCSADTLESSATMVELLRRALLVSDPGNEQLMESVLNLARMTGNRSLIEKLNKLFDNFTVYLCNGTKPTSHAHEVQKPSYPARRLYSPSS